MAETKTKKAAPQAKVKASASKKATTVKASAKDSRFKNDLKNVQDHYLDYPYPARDPEDDKKRIMRMQGDFFGEISHNLYKGKQDFKKGFRALVAGGGTGDSTVWLAKQLMDCPDAEVVYVDFSKNSMAIAQKRAEYQKVNNITWIEDSLLNIPKLDLGKFDFVNCIGVLHHLENPDLGLQILSDSLKEDGGGSIMVYGQYGRTGVYQIQDLLRMTGQGLTSRKEEVSSAWDVMNSLPVTNWFVRGQEMLQDHKMYGDIGLYDLFLHKQDRAYTIPQLYEFVEKAGLNIAAFVDPYMRAVLNIDSYMGDSSTKERIKAMPIRQQQAICELMAGNIIKHSIHISKKKDTVADFDDLDNVPYAFNAPTLAQSIIKFIEENENKVMNKAVKYSFKDSMQREMTMNLGVLPHTKYLFKYFDKGTMSLKEIFAAVRAEAGVKTSDKDLSMEFNLNLKPLYTMGCVLLRHKSVPNYDSFNELSN